MLFVYTNHGYVLYDQLYFVHTVLLSAAVYDHPYVVHTVVLSAAVMSYQF